ncbi:hypothetical protein OESDEN_02569 [Oesophagostomum dentatum]|uniref:Transcription factor 25 n=1 Tax=Oesophagostomum dentatum TaxID=61180 RepID=A0A0B1TIR2_OESDE|nr:hypothetical protein OESDEN_02569 [Oesophagostomum dentatum]
MSTKHLRRFIEEKEHEDESIEAEEELPFSQKTGPVNRFAAFVDDDGEAVRSGTSDEDAKTPPHSSDMQPESLSLASSTKNEKKTKRKKKRKQKKNDTDELTEDQLLEKFASENQNTPSILEDEMPLGVDQVLKPDPRLYDAAAELKRALGKAFKDAAPVSSRSHRTFHGAGKIVKQKFNWPPVRNIGLSMELDREEGDVKWFKFIHNSHYEKLERLCWVSEDSFDPGLIEEILVDNPYHLNSLLLLANVFRMQEDITQSCDVIGRFIDFRENVGFSTVNSRWPALSSRARFIIECFETALNFAKLILTMDPQSKVSSMLVR